jgi:aspartate kinase
VLTADPRIVADARNDSSDSPIKKPLSWRISARKSSSENDSARRFDNSIPVRVCNARAPRDPGTLIVAESESRPQTIKAIAHKNGITTVQVTSARMLGAYGFLRALFEVFDRHKTAVDVVTTSEVSVSLSIDDARTDGGADSGSRTTRHS